MQPTSKKWQWQFVVMGIGVLVIAAVIVKVGLSSSEQTRITVAEQQAKTIIIATLELSCMALVDRLPPSEMAPGKAEEDANSFIHNARARGTLKIPQGVGQLRYHQVSPVGSNEFELSYEPSAEDNEQLRAALRRFTVGYRVANTQEILADGDSCGYILRKQQESMCHGPFC